MIGIVLVAHGKLAEAFLDVVHTVSGQQKQIATFSVSTNDDIEHRRDDLIARIESVDSGKGVIVLTDLFGGTASNLAISVLAVWSIEVIAGMNLPMILKILSMRQTENLTTLVQKAEEAGKKYIRIASEYLTTKPLPLNHIVVA
jgi:PTS system mannose-specific IIA component